MSTITYTLICLIMVFSVTSAHSVQANETGFGVPKVTAYPTRIPSSRAGKVTGLNCDADNDCTLGCKTGSEDIVCLTYEETSNACVNPDEPPKSDYACACLPDVKRCGFIFASITKEKEEAAERAAEEMKNQPVPLVEPAKKPTPKKHHKKSPKKKHKTKKSTVHDSGK